MFVCLFAALPLFQHCGGIEKKVESPFFDKALLSVLIGLKHEQGGYILFIGITQCAICAYNILLSWHSTLRHGLINETRTMRLKGQLLVCLFFFVWLFVCLFFGVCF